MTDTAVLDLALAAMVISVKLAAPVLLTALGIGFVVSLFQSVTQIQEVTVSFVPKVIGIGVVIMLTGNWMLHEIVEFTGSLYDRLPDLLNS